MYIVEKLDQKYMSAFREIEEPIDSTVSFQKNSNLIVEKVTCFLEAKGARMLILDTVVNNFQPPRPFSPE